MPFPFQIVQGSSPYILIAYEFTSATRTIRMNWKDEAPTDSWMGWSRGRWEGDTLVVDVTGQREETWFDRAGDFHSDALHVVERYTPVSPYHLMYEATIEDPKVFTRPWKISFPLYRRMEKNVQLLEFKCVPFTEELLYGKFRKAERRRQMTCRSCDSLVAADRVRIAPGDRRPGAAGQEGSRRRQTGGEEGVDRRRDAVGRSGSAGRLERRHQHAAATARRAGGKGRAQRRGSGGFPAADGARSDPRSPRRRARRRRQPRLQRALDGLRGG